MKIIFLLALLAVPYILIACIVTLISYLVSSKSPSEKRRDKQHELLIFSSVLTIYCLLLAVLYFLIW